MSSITENRLWRTVGLISTVIIMFSIPMALLFHEDMEIKLITVDNAEFVGKETCVDCHKKEYDLWNDSHHAKAMAVANDSTVLGDFDNAEFAYKGKIHKFYKKDTGFFAFTEGPGGEMGEYPITHTFGYTPLQQYLVPFPGGRYQCLPIAWDTEKRQWFHMAGMVYKEDELRPDSWLYWTNQSQNWNGMCAECHSTNLQKNFDPASKTYNTTWSEINISCEACHGPGSAHLEWAKLPEMGRDYDGDLGLVLKHSTLSSFQQVDLCAPCHSRRGSLGPYDFHQPELLNNAEPQLITEPLYFIDGQILDEVYVYGSFTQSKMYLNDVQCKDCHDVHSGKRLFEGNALCLQCHRANAYDAYDHHFHKKKGEKGNPIERVDGGIIEVGEGALCEKCHMPGRYYMGIDYRPDHSMRIPRPDLTSKIGSPNACNDCHADKDANWSQSYIVKWYGTARKPHYGEIFHAASNGDTSVINDLSGMAVDELYTELVRATAVYYLSTYQFPEARAAAYNALNDNNALVRFTASRNFNSTDLADYLNYLFPLLQDPVKSVRQSAASQLISLPRNSFNAKQLRLLEEVAAEYEASLFYVADFASARHNLGNYYVNMNNPEKALTNFREAILIDNAFFPAKVNLALLYYNRGDANSAEYVYLDLIKNHPEYNEAHYHLGLLYAEQKRYEDAINQLEIAARNPDAGYRVYYNLGLLYQYFNKQVNTENALLEANMKEPGNLNVLHALADHYIKRGDLSAARKYALVLRDTHPENPIGQQILDYISGQR